LFSVYQSPFPPVSNEPAHSMSGFVPLHKRMPWLGYYRRILYFFYDHHFDMRSSPTWANPSLAQHHPMCRSSLPPSHFPYYGCLVVVVVVLRSGYDFLLDYF
jgi:hypothetical protein